MWMDRIAMPALALNSRAGGLARSVGGDASDHWVPSDFVWDLAVNQTNYPNDYSYDNLDGDITNYFVINDDL